MLSGPVAHSGGGGLICCSRYSSVPGPEANYRSDVNTAMLLESLIAPLYLRMLVTGEAVEDWPYVEAIDCALAAIGSRRSGLARATKR